MKTYYISVDIDQGGIMAEDEEEALAEANRLIHEGNYTLEIADIDEE